MLIGRDRYGLIIACRALVHANAQGARVDLENEKPALVWNGLNSFQAPKELRRAPLGVIVNVRA